MNEIFNHLWQSTAFAAAVALVCVALRRNSPRLRYWLWLAASLKFLIPFSLLVSTGARIQLPPDTPSLHAVTVQQISGYFAPISDFPAPAPARATFQWPLMPAAIWLAGALFLLFRWFRRWRTIHRAARRATRLPLRHSMPVFSSPATMEPGVFGIFRPMLLLPEGIDDKLTPEQFEAVLAHELCHIRYRDNLTAALHMCVETLFWFHPLVWWIGARLMEERERDCDEAVLRQGSQPGDYARGIVQVCEAYVESPLACASGISGSDLKKRIREIMTWRGSLPVTLRGKAMLAAATVAAVSIPFVIGILRAQTLPPDPAYTYEAVSIHKSDPANLPYWGPGPQGGWRAGNAVVLSLILFAFDAQEYRVIGLPAWVSSEHYDVTFTADKSEIAPDPQTHMKRTRQRMQAVLRDRFGLVVRPETRQLPVYKLTVAKSGLKLPPHDNAQPDSSTLQANRSGHLILKAVTLEGIARDLSDMLDRPVIDETHVKGDYDFNLEWARHPDLSPDSFPSIFTALTDQLGLRLESTKGPVQVYAIEKIEKPSEN